MKVNSTVSGTTPLHRAIAISASPAVVAKLLAHGAKADATDTGMRTPQHLLAEGKRSLRDKTAILAALLGHGANLQARDGWDRTPREAAEADGHPMTARLLACAGG